MSCILESDSNIVGVSPIHLVFAGILNVGKPTENRNLPPFLLPVEEFAVLLLENSRKQHGGQ